MKSKQLKDGFVFYFSFLQMVRCISLISNTQIKNFSYFVFIGVIS